MAKKICNWDEAKPEGTFDSKATANEYVRGRMAEFNILRDADLTPETWARAFRFDFSAAMASTLSDKMRKFGSLLVRDSTPKKGNTNYTRPVTISEVKDMNVDRMMVLYHVPHTNFLKKWLMEQKKLGRYKWNSPNNNLVRKEFNDLVGRAIRGEQIALSELGYTTSEAQKLIQQMAKVQSQLLNEQLQMLKIVGVEGAENIVDNFNYLTRVHNPIKYQKILDDPTKGSQYLKVFLVNAMEDTMLKGVKQKPLTAAQKMTIAENLITVVNRSNFSKGGVNLDHIVTSMQKRETFRRMMQEHTNMVDEEIDALINRMFKVKPGEQVSGSSYLKRRIRFNEGYTDGRTNFSDLLENNAEALFMNYTHSAMGDMALAYKGIKSRGDFQRIRQEIVESYDANPKASATKRAVWQAKNEIQAMDMAYAYIKGRPLAENPTGLAPTIGRFIRKLNYSRVMNQVGFANMSEMGNVTGLIGWNATLKNVPELRRMMKRLENGERVDEFIREIDYTMGGIGNHSIIQQVTNRLDDFGSSMSDDVITTAENKLDQMNRFTNTYSGQFMSTSAMQIVTVSEFTQIFGRWAVGKGKHPFAKLRFGKNRMSDVQMQNRMDDLGISPSMMKKIQNEFKAHTSWTKGELGTRITKTNFDKWSNETRAVYIMAMRRLAHRTIQQADIGEKAYFGFLKEYGMNADGHLGQIAYQFRSFMFTSWAKQFLYGLKMRDAIVFDQFMNSMLWGSLMFSAQTSLAGLVHPNQKEFYKNRLNPATIAKAGFQRAAFASLLPIGANIIGSAYTDNPIFGYRTSGLDTNIITGNPTYSLIFQKLIPSLKAVSQSTFNPERTFSQADGNKAIGILPFYNLIGLQQFLRAITSELPKDRQQ
jgi:hypothetical protein